MRPILRQLMLVTSLAFAPSPSWGQSHEQMNEANNPLTPKIGVNLQDQYVDRMYDLDGWSNAFLLRATIPHKLGGTGQILRVTAPVVTAPSLTGDGRTTAFGDLNLIDIALFKHGVHALPIYGGQSFERQLVGLRKGANIVIGTPGRVMDHMRRGTLKLAGVKMAVLDEVDVMLNMGFREDIEVILQSAPLERQTVFFSATIPRPIQQLIEKYSRNPKQVRIEQSALTVPTVEQIYYEVARDYKLELLTRLRQSQDVPELRRAFAVTVNGVAAGMRNTG